MSRADQVLPEGWKPKVGSTVHVEESKDEPAPPHGRWKVVSAAPGTGMWWLLPVGEEARAWLEHFPSQRHLGGCITRSGRQLVPLGFRRPAAKDLSAATLQRMAAGGRR